MTDLHQRLATQGVHTLIAQFADVHGTAKGKYVPLAHLDDLLKTGAGFAGPSIWGTALPRTGARAEYYARPTEDNIQALPWMPGYALATSSGFVDNQPFEACPRQVLQRATGRLAERGWRLKTGIEPEFFLLKAKDGRWLPADDADRLDKPSYDLKSMPRQAAFLQALGQALTDAGLDVLQLDHEDAHGQYEVNFAFDEALASADHLMLFKLAAHTLAEQHGTVFSMMPKPFANQPGSGLHFHVSLWDEANRCVFAPVADEPGALLSPLARHFIGGVLAHSAALCALAAPTVNSYKRLVVGESLSGTSWAPAYVAHGPNNRTAVVRTLPGRFEWRLPDASANPYLATAALIAAGLDGIDRQLDPGPDCTEDLFALSLGEIRARGIALLPQSLDEAADALAADEIVCAALGPVLSAEFIRLKKAEWLAYARHVSDWELQRYATMF
ncbi:type III glutamate--ammonia ligase [Ideonella azotifigens]|uniref:Type III glutamate--ammonia ligase n=1 Tax=Ideonella azotifigens TaxID=513160 RepID=A0ABN1K8N6_9BURK|nr:type III glutamate--ammonia ligase [Ideonella azotifigens]MCD2342863.1 type III glutamate--ammonia ligase [Ideonella azotifigens]